MWLLSTQSHSFRILWMHYLKFNWAQIRSSFYFESASFSGLLELWAAPTDIYGSFISFSVGHRVYSIVMPSQNQLAARLVSLFTGFDLHATIPIHSSSSLSVLKVSFFQMDFWWNERWLRTCLRIRIDTSASRGSNHFVFLFSLFFLWDNSFTYSFHI